MIPDHSGPTQVFLANFESFSTEFAANFTAKFQNALKWAVLGPDMGPKLSFDSSGLVWSKPQVSVAAIVRVVIIIHDPVFICVGF